MNADRVEMLRIAQVKKIIGLSRSTIYSLISQGSFPRQVNLGPKAVAWISSEIQTWVAARITQSRGVKEEVSQ
jgi:prophage regulatory protein